MSQKRKSTTSSGASIMKKVRKSLTLERKVEVLSLFDEGLRTTDVARAMNLQRTTVQTILKNAIKIRASVQAGTSKACAVLTKSRSVTIEKMEKLLIIWIEDLNQKNIPVNTKLVQEKAKTLFNDLKSTQGDDNNEAFQASRGWFDRFRHRSKLYNIKMTGEATSGATESAQTYPMTLATIISECGYSPQQVFNVDETGLFWKKMLSKIFASIDENINSVYFKESNDRLTLLLGGNATGDFKLKPFLVYHSENPKAMKDISKNTLPVMWRSNKKEYITSTLFVDWFKTYFCPAVKDYCLKNNLSHKVLLVLDKAPAHPVHLNDLDEHIKVIFLPPNTTPMDQGVIALFKAYYLRQTFRQLVETIDLEGHSQTIIKSFWRDFNIIKAIGNIHESWNEVSSTNMNRVWKKILPGYVDHVEELNEISSIQKEIVEMARQVGFTTVDETKVIEVLQSHNEEMSNEELIQLLQSPTASDDERSEVECSESMDDKESEAATSSFPEVHLSAALKNLDEAMKLFTRYDPDKERSARINDNISKAIAPYREISD